MSVHQGQEQDELLTPGSVGLTTPNFRRSSWLTLGKDQEEHPATEMSTLLDEMLENLTAKVDQVGEEINAKRAHHDTLFHRMQRADVL